MCDTSYLKFLCSKQSVVHEFENTISRNFQHTITPENFVQNCVENKTAVAIKWTNKSIIICSHKSSI